MKLVSVGTLWINMDNVTYIDFAEDDDGVAKLIIAFGNAANLDAMIELREDDPEVVRFREWLEERSAVMRDA